MAQQRTIARPYAAALFELASKDDSVGLWSERLDFLARACKHEAIEKMLADPALPGEVKAHHLFDLLEAHFGGQADEQTGAAALRNFVLLLGMNKRLDVFSEIAEEFARLRQASEKRHQVFVTTAFPLEGAQREQIETRLSNKLGGQVEIHEQTDDSLVGGAIIRYGDQVIDGSLRGRLSKLRESLLKRAA